MELGELSEPPAGRPAGTLRDPSKMGGCLFTQSHADHVIGLQDERSLHIDEGRSVLDTGACVLKAGGVCAPPQVRKLYK